jgi:hypothetical protein
MFTQAPTNPTREYLRTLCTTAPARRNTNTHRPGLSQTQAGPSHLVLLCKITTAISIPRRHTLSPTDGISIIESQHRQHQPQEVTPWQ